MDQIRPQNVFGAAQQGYAFGTQVKQQREQEQNRNALRALAPEIIAGNPDALAQGAVIDPAAAGQYDTVAVNIAKRGAGAASYILDAVKRGNPAEIEGRYQAVVPFLTKMGAAQGKVPPPNFDPAMIPLMEQLVAKSQGLGGEGGEVPTGYRQFQLTAEAAGLRPGTPEYEQAANIALGREGRAATGGFSFEMVEGPDGKKRPGRRNPRDGSIEVFSEQVNDFVPIGAPGALNGQPAPSSSGPSAGLPAVPGIPQGGQGALDINADMQTFASLGIPISSTRRDQRKNAAVGGVDNSYHLTGEALDVAPQNQQQKQQAQEYWGSRGYQVIDEGDHLHIEPPRRGMTVSQIGGPRSAGIAVSRAPEEQAALTTAAQEEARLGVLPRELALRTDAAVDQAVRSDVGKADAERTALARSTLPKVRTDANELIGLIGQLKNSPGLADLTGMSGLNPLNKIPGSAATDAQVLLDQVKGKAFLQAFASLKGAGAITEQEGQKATEAIARLNTRQSDAAMQASLDDLVSIVQTGMLRAEQQAGGGSGQTPARQVRRTGMLNGRKVVQYSDGTTEYAD